LSKGEAPATPDVKTLCAELTTVWDETIPLSKAMGVELVSFDNNVLTVAADLEPNINLHGTGFAGSLYAINALCGWSMVHLQLQLRGLQGSIVLADGRIKYARPVQEPIVAVCDFGEQLSALDALQHAGKARFTVTSVIHSGGKSAATFLTGHRPWVRHPEFRQPRSADAWC